ncbi:hypothetical protein F5B22DRAFT_351284 [Xylaria bambusicola]|uniref:uncharacterized protein n=1 Tax=Xylaria bambusicola TaxID=326684 RepID=UPI002007911A|nr:uncharacterized protein F5B22DRAFT_351284 [Xylaria bambusicola]KAI0525607.1 hypothetical protein F5B22DRAFT_351284 [Xylaria bambusicola]
MAWLSMARPFVLLIWGLSHVALYPVVVQNIRASTLLACVAGFRHTRPGQKREFEESRIRAVGSTISRPKGDEIRQAERARTLPKLLPAAPSNTVRRVDLWSFTYQTTKRW